LECKPVFAEEWPRTPAGAIGGCRRRRAINGLRQLSWACLTREWDYDQQATVATVRSKQMHQYTGAASFSALARWHLLPVAGLNKRRETFCSIVWSKTPWKPGA